MIKNPIFLFAIFGIVLAAVKKFPGRKKSLISFYVLTLFGPVLVVKGGFL